MKLPWDARTWGERQLLGALVGLLFLVATEIVDRWLPGFLTPEIRNAITLLCTAVVAWVVDGDAKKSSEELASMYVDQIDEMRTEASTLRRSLVLAGMAKHRTDAMAGLRDREGHPEAERLSSPDHEAEG